MPLSQCPGCGFTCRSMFFTASAPSCPECERQMSFIGRAAIEERRATKLPRLPLQPRTREERLRQRIAG